MPTYSFRCAAGHGFDRLISLSRRDEPQECPDCAGAAERVFVPNNNVLIPMRLHTSFLDIAPRDADGQPMTVIEAAKSGKYHRYSKSEELRADNAKRRKVKRNHDNAMRESMAEAWDDQKVTIRSSQL